MSDPTDIARRQRHVQDLFEHLAERAIAFRRFPTLSLRCDASCTYFRAEWPSRLLLRGEPAWGASTAIEVRLCYDAHEWDRAPDGTSIPGSERRVIRAESTSFVDMIFDNAVRHLTEAGIL